MFGELPRSRSEAKSSGASHYFTGEPCKHGHVEKRLASTGACAECMRVRQRERMKSDPEYRELHRKSCRKRMARLLSDPETKQRIREREKELQRSNEDRKFKKRLADQRRHARKYEDESYRQLIHERSKKRYEIKKCDPVFKEQTKIRGQQWCVNNREKVRARCARRRAQRKSATPKWLDAKMLESISQFYWMANALSKVTGREYEVDHVVPLSGESVCGLHVPWNLQLLLRDENRAKRNKADWVRHGN